MNITNLANATLSAAIEQSHEAARNLTGKRYHTAPRELPSLALPGLLLWKLGLGELVVPGTCDLCAVRTATECTLYINHAKRTLGIILPCTCTGPG